MAVNNLYLLKSGVSGWIDTYNTGLSFSSNKLGIGVENPDYRLHVGNQGQNPLSPQFVIQDTQFYKGHPSGVVTQMRFLDSSGQSMATFKHQDHDLIISQGDTGAISLEILDGRQVTFTESGMLGVCQPSPKSKIHVVQDLSGQDVAILKTRMTQPH